MAKKLNLGCGEFHKEGYVNVDCFSVSKPDIVHDLNLIPYPFSDNEFSVIEADHVLEHLEAPLRIMTEIHRIGQPEALVIIRVPHFSRGFTHPDHKRGFDFTFPYYFKPDFIGGYQGVEFQLRKVKMNWLAQPYLKKTVMPKRMFQVAMLISEVINFFANLSPALCSRILCFWVGGFEEIEFHFTVRKN